MSACPHCDGLGFVWLNAIEVHSDHRRNGTTAFVKTLVRFRAPCRCKAGDIWGSLTYEERCRREKLLRTR